MTLVRIVLYLAIGMTVGSLSGALGIGGGVLLVPALVWLCHFKLPRAAGTSLAILIPPIGLPAAWRAYQENRVDFPAAMWIAAAFTIGAYFGSAVVRHIPDIFLRFLFGLLMIYIAVHFMLGSDSQAANAAAGLSAVVLAWITFWFTRRLGRRHLSQPNLGEQIRAMQQQDRGDPDYHI